MKVRRSSSTRTAGSAKPAHARARARRQDAAAATAPGAGAHDSCHVSRFTFHAESAIALVVTLILLAVITFMAITFLVVSTTGKQNSNTLKEEITARQAMDVGFEQATANILANLLAYTNPTLALMVSTNYDTRAFVSANTSFTNTSYTY